MAGTITAALRLKNMPDIIFIPDVPYNLMIVREAKMRRVPIIAPVNSDCPTHVDFPIFSNALSYEMTVQITQLIIGLNRLKPKTNCDRKFKFAKNGFHFG